MTSIGEKAFKDNNIKDILIGENVIEIEPNAFENNFNIRKITILGDEKRFNDH